MALFHMQMIFNLGRQGWTEGFYLSEDTPATAATKVAQVAQVRSSLMGANVILDGIRLSRVDVRGDTQPIGLIAGANKNNNYQPNFQDGLLWSMRFSSGVVNDGLSIYRRNYIMRGHDPFAAVPNPVFGVDPKVYSGLQSTSERIASNWVADYEAYFVALKAAGCGDLVNIKTTAASVIMSAFADDDNNVVFVLKDAPAIAPGDTILVAGLKRSYKPCNGTWEVIANKLADPLHITIKKTSPGGVFIPPGFMQKKVKAIATILDWQFLRTVSRETGKSFFVTPGKSKKQEIKY